MGRLALAGLGAVALGAPALAVANDAAFKAVVPFSGGRHVDLRAGEPLEFFYAHETITKVCWSPAPIQRASCGTSFAAAAKPGKQKITLTLKSGAVKHETLTIGVPVGHVPAFAEAGLPNTRIAEFEAKCDEDGYAGYSGGKLRGADEDTAVQTGDEVAVFYTRGHVLLGMPYHTGEARFYDRSCLKPVNR